MTSSSWTNLSYYGLRLKRDFTHLDTLIKKSKKIENPNDLDIDTMLKMMKHKATIAMDVTKMMELTDTIKRVENMEAILRAVRPEALAEAQKIIDA